MSTLNTHYGTNLTWKAFKEGDNTFSITFTLDSVAYDISAIPFTVRFRRTMGGSDLFTLTQSTGLTNGGATGILTVPLTLANIQTYFPGDYYYYLIEYTISSKVYALYQGGIQLSTENQGSTTISETVELNLGGVNVDAAITLAGGSGGGGSGGSSDIDGGSAASVYLPSENIDGGTA